MTMKIRYILKWASIDQLSEFIDVIEKGDRNFELESATCYFILSYSCALLAPAPPPGGGRGGGYSLIWAR